MLMALQTAGRILVRHWPGLMAWFLAGEAAHGLLVRLAGFIGGFTTLGGLLVLPLAVAGKLIAYVAMYLTVRPSLPHVASPEIQGDRSARYREFGGAILVSILPFFAFYSAWGLQDADFIEFAKIASATAFADTGYGTALTDRGGVISIGVLPVTVLVIALIARITIGRFQDRLQGWGMAVAAYTEMLWTFMLFILVAQWWNGARDWLEDRAGMAWLQSIGDWFAMNIAPVAFVWEAGVWLAGLLAASLIMPAAWLAVAGVIYGTTFDATPRSLRRRTESLRGAVSALSRTLLQRLENLWAAVAVVWRGGPVLFGATVCVYALWGLAERWGARGVLVLIGGHETNFWQACLPLILVGTATVFEPIRVAIVATAYDAVIARPEAGLEASADGGSGVDGKTGDLALAGHVQFERAGGVVGKHEHGDNVIAD